MAKDNLGFEMLNETCIYFSQVSPKFSITYYLHKIMTDTYLLYDSNLTIETEKTAHIYLKIKIGGGVWPGGIGQLPDICYPLK